MRIWVSGISHGIWGIVLFFLLISIIPSMEAQPLIFPEPREAELRNECFPLDSSVPVLIPRETPGDDLFLAQFLQRELSEKYGVALEIRRVSNLPVGGRFILMGSAANPLVREYLSSRNMESKVNAPEGYWLGVDATSVVVAGADDAGAFYGLQSVRQLIQREGAQKWIKGILVRDWPGKPFRGIKLYLPGHQNILFFKRFVRNFLSLYKFNQVIVEINAAMRFERHPELNAGWLEFSRDMNYTRRERSWGPGRQVQDSANADTADGEVLEKEEVAELVRYARKHHVDVIPEVPSLTHSYYLLSRHRELAEIVTAEWPDTYCPLAPGVQRLLFDILDEIIEVTQPKMVHIGHDEWRMPLDVCPRCKGKDPGELFAEDLNQIAEYLRHRNIRTVIYGDHLIEPLRGKRSRKVPNPGGTPYETPGALSVEQVKELVPKDILIFNWFWDDRAEGQGEANDIALEEWGFQQVYNNLLPDIANYDRRAGRSSVLGGVPSSWAATNEFNFGKDLMFDFLGSAQLLWAMRQLPQDRLSEIVQSLLPSIRRDLCATPFPGDYDPVVPLNIESFLTAEGMPGASMDTLRNGRIVARNKVFELAPPGGRRLIVVETGNAKSPAIRIGEDVSSVIFLHASTEPARNIFAYAGTWNFADTADLLGWYEVVYADALVQTVPIRYGVNILESSWGHGHAPKNLAYEAELVECARPDKDRITFFAYEWVNPRLGIPIKEIRLHGSVKYVNAAGEAASPNRILLAAISVVKKRSSPEPGRLKTGD